MKNKPQNSVTGQIGNSNLGWEFEKNTAIESASWYNCGRSVCDLRVFGKAEVPCSPHLLPRQPLTLTPLSQV